MSLFLETDLTDIFKSKKILIVDDNEKTIQLLGDFLKSNGDFNTTVAKNGKEAIELFIHLVLYLHLLYL